PRRVEGRRAEKDDFRVVLGRLFRHGIEHADAGRPLAILVVENLGDDGIRLEREAIRGPRRWQCGRLRAEVAAVRAAEPTGVAVLAWIAVRQLEGRVCRAPGNDPPAAAIQLL